MLEELIALFIVSRPVEAPITRCPPDLATASQEAKESLVDTYSMAKTAQGDLGLTSVITYAEAATMGYHGCRGMLKDRDGELEGGE